MEHYSDNWVSVDSVPYHYWIVQFNFVTDSDYLHLLCVHVVNVYVHVLYITCTCMFSSGHKNHVHVPNSILYHTCIVCSVVLYITCTCMFSSGHKTMYMYVPNSILYHTCIVCSVVLLVHECTLSTFFYFNLIILVTKLYCTVLYCTIFVLYSYCTCTCTYIYMFYTMQYMYIAKLCAVFVLYMYMYMYIYMFYTMQYKYKYIAKQYNTGECVHVL